MGSVCTHVAGQSDGPAFTATRHVRAIFNQGAKCGLTPFQLGDFRPQFNQLIKWGKVTHGVLLCLSIFGVCQRSAVISKYFAKAT